MNELHAISSTQQAAAVLGHPLRRQILAAAQSPVSASDIARSLGQPRQRVNYHVRQLAAAGLLIRADQQRKGNMVEQQYVASARSYVMNSDVLGDIAPAESADPDPASAARLAALCARTQRDVTFLMSAARSAGVRLKTLSLEEDLYFSTAQSRTDFMNDLVDAVQNVIADHDANLETTDKVRAFRLLLACYPQPD